jgi:hypothetical protein
MPGEETSGKQSAVKTVPAPVSKSSAPLSSLSSAPSLSKPSSLGSLAPLAPLGRPRATVKDADSSHDSLPEEDARAVAAMDSKISALKKSASVERSEEYDDSFTQHDQSGVEEDIEIEAEEDYSEEEF